MNNLACCSVWFSTISVELLVHRASATSLVLKHSDVHMLLKQSMLPPEVGFNGDYVNAIQYRNIKAGNGFHIVENNDDSRYVTLWKDRSVPQRLEVNCKMLIGISGIVPERF